MSELKKLRDLADKAIKAYNDPEMDSIMLDHEYDELIHKIKELEGDKHTGVTAEIQGPKGVANRKEIKHLSKMYSIDNLMNLDDVSDWIQKLPLGKDDILILEPKYDGLSANIVYSNGELMYASTNSDGEMGISITDVIKMVNVPTKFSNNANLTGSVEIRGELVLPKKAFDELNVTRAEQGKKVYANTRNAAAGLTLSGSKDCKYLQFIPYAIGQGVKALNLNTQQEVLEYLRLVLKFTLAIDDIVTVKAKSVNELISKLQHYENKRESLPYDIDGVCIKVNSLKDQQTMGFTSRAPKWVKAYKFKPNTLRTKLIAVQWQVGKEGVITPVGIIEPTKISGSVINQATLHNLNMIRSKGLHIGDTVGIRKAGDVVPEITNTLESAKEGKEITAPKKCPSCSGKTTVTDNQVTCTNSSCPGQLVRRLMHATKRDALNIKGLGEKLCEKLISCSIITKLADVFTLDLQKLKKADIVGKVATNLLDSISKSKAVANNKLLYSLTISNIGRSASKAICKVYPDHRVWSDLTYNQVAKIVGDVAGNNFVNYFEDATNRDNFNSLIKLLNITKPSNKPTSDKFKGLAFVITGAVSNRRDLKNKIMSAGGVVRSSVTTKTSYLIAGEKAGSKLTKAKQLGIPVITEEELDTVVK